jgi:hypothetical protein
VTFGRCLVRRASPIGMPAALYCTASLTHRHTGWTLLRSEPHPQARWQHYCLVRRASPIGTLAALYCTESLTHRHAGSTIARRASPKHADGTLSCNLTFSAASLTHGHADSTLFFCLLSSHHGAALTHPINIVFSQSNPQSCA